MTKIEFLKAADRTVGRPLVYFLSLLPRRHHSSPTEPQSALFIRPGGIGDAVLLLPAIRAARKRFRGMSIDVLCEKRNAGVFGLSADIREVHRYDSAGGLVRCLRNRYDAVVDTEQWHRLSAVVARLAGAPETIGFGTNERARLFTRSFPYRHEDYEAESFLKLVSALTGEAAALAPGEAFLEVPAHEAPGGVPGSRTFSKGLVAVFPGASVAERRWGGERYGQVARGLQEKGYRVVIVGSRQDEQDAAVIQRLAPESVNMAGRTSLRDVASLLRSCKLLVTADSGLMHIAAAVGTPTVSLFGSGIQEKWAPRGPLHIVVNKRLSCSPCTRFGYTPRCTKGVRCLTLITAGDVLEAAERVLALSG